VVESASEPSFRAAICLKADYSVKRALSKTRLSAPGSCLRLATQARAYGIECQWAIEPGSRKPPWALSNPRGTSDLTRKSSADAPKRASHPEIPDSAPPGSSKLSRALSPCCLIGALADLPVLLPRLIVGDALFSFARFEERQQLVDAPYGIDLRDNCRSVRFSKQYMPKVKRFDQSGSFASAQSLRDC